MFDKIGKESKDLLGKGMDTEKKFSFKTAAFDGLSFESATTDGAKLSTTGSFKLSDDSGMDVQYKYDKSTDYKYSFESNFDLAKLADIKGAKVVLSGDNNQTVSGKLEYNHSLAAISLTGGVQAGAISFPFSVGVSPASGLSLGVSGKVLPAPKPDQLYENVHLAYDQKGSFGLFLGLSKTKAGPLKALEARGIYHGLPDTKVAVKAVGLMEKAPLFTVGGEYTLDKATSIKVVVAQKDVQIKAGVKKNLRKGCDLTVGYAVKAGDIADPSKHTIGFTPVTTERL